MELKLLVIRTSEPEKLVQFYGLLGLKFDHHKHGNAPFHYSTTLGQTVLEIYPLTKNQVGPDRNLRIGFEMDNWNQTIYELKTDHKVEFLTEPTQTDFGFIAIIKDPDGRKIELYRKKRKAIRVEIVSFVDAHFPGFVSSKFKDVWGREHIIIDKVPVVSEMSLNAESQYPQEGKMGCEIIREWINADGRTINTVDTAQFCGVETTEGKTAFDVFEDQLIEING
jgi:lactoylglutathione lyase